MPWARIAGDSGPGTALPSNPVDGQEFAYTADATNGVIWRFKYRAAASSNKWEFVGGGHLSSGPTPSVASPFSFGGNSWVTFTNGPSVTIPLSGDYIVQWAVNLQNQSFVVAYDMAAGLSVAGADPSEYGSFVVPNAQYGGAVAGRTERRSVTANNTLTIRLRTNRAESNSTWARGATLAVTPVRVG